MTRRVSAAEAKTHLSELLSRVAANDERIITERRVSRSQR
jgi:antitoxin (DNA-binding transcriptional repressor) of toxin-antitoxin stability system